MPNIHYTEVIQKMTSNVNTGVLMRMDSTARIQECYRERKLTFSCAANWVDYAMNGNYETGDFLECVFAHLPVWDKRLYELKDSHGLPMGRHVFILYQRDLPTAYVRYIPTLLTPAMCFFSFAAEHKKNVPSSCIPALHGIPPLDLDRYRAAMNYSREDSSFLFIMDFDSFYKELKAAIPIAVQRNADMLTTERYYENGQTVELFMKEVDYHRHGINDLYFDNAFTPGEELFWKSPKYSWQSELRFTISNINFKQCYDPTQYDYRKNRLDVYLPHLQEYSIVVPANEVGSVEFPETGTPNEMQCIIRAKR